MDIDKLKTIVVNEITKKKKGKKKMAKKKKKSKSKPRRRSATFSYTQLIVLIVVGIGSVGLLTKFFKLPQKYIVAFIASFITLYAGKKFLGPKTVPIAAALGAAGILEWAKTNPSTAAYFSDYVTNAAMPPKIPDVTYLPGQGQGPTGDYFSHGVMPEIQQREVELVQRRYA